MMMTMVIITMMTVTTLMMTMTTMMVYDDATTITRARSDALRRS